MDSFDALLALGNSEAPASRPKQLPTDSFEREMHHRGRANTLRNPLKTEATYDAPREISEQKASRVEMRLQELEKGWIERGRRATHKAVRHPR